MLNVNENTIKDKENLSKRAKNTKLWVTLGSIVLGALGSAMWELVGKPVFATISRAIFNIITSSVKGVSDNIYKDVASGQYQSFNILGIVIPPIIFCFVLILIQMVNAIWVKLYGMEIAFLNRDTNKQNLISKNIRVENVSIGLPEKQRRFLLFTVILSIFMTVLSIFTAISNYYTVQYTCYYKTLVTITTPYISSEQKDTFNSNFSQIQNKDDYKKIIKELEGVSDRNNLKYRKITID